MSRIGIVVFCKKTSQKYLKKKILDTATEAELDAPKSVSKKLVLKIT